MKFNELKDKITRKPKVFLGGTCNGSTWRDELIPMLKIDFFNPVVDDWDEKAQKQEIEERAICNYVLYVITPKMTGVFSIAEAVDDSNKQPQKTIFVVLDSDEDESFSEFQLKSLNSVSKMIKNNGGKIFTNLKETAKYLNEN